MTIPLSKTIHRQRWMASAFGGVRKRPLPHACRNNTVCRLIHGLPFTKNPSESHWYRYQSTTTTTNYSMPNDPNGDKSRHGSTKMLSQSACLQDDPEDLYEDRSRLSTEPMDDLPCSVSVENNGQSVCITIPYDYLGENDIEDGEEDRCLEFSSPLLWANDPQYIHPSSGGRLRTLGQYSKDFKVVHARLVSTNDEFIEDEKTYQRKTLHTLPPRGSLHSRGGIYELSSSTTNDDRSTSRRTLVVLKWNYGEESMFDLEWLLHHGRNNCLGRWKPKTTVLYQYKAEQTQERRTDKTTAVTKEIAIRAPGVDDCSVSTFDYKRIMDDDESLLDGMMEIFERGAILIRNAPDANTECIVGNLGKRFAGGSLSHGSLYGDVFHVKATTNANNVAYTNLALPPHQDLTYYESKPFLQLLHCATNNSTGTIVGGESVLIDSMAAAEELRRIAPDLFEILCKVEATFVKERQDADMVSPKPHIVVDSTLGQVVEVNWSPPFEGLLQINSTISVTDYVRAYQAFERMLDDDDDEKSDCYESLLPKALERELRKYAKNYTWEYSLKMGEILVFNNQRMLHGRRSFRAFGDVQRHLIGCYTDAMETTSRYRCLLREQRGRSGWGYGRRNHGSGYRWM